MKKFKVKKKHLTGQISDFPRRVVQALVDEQVRQGNPADPSVFARSLNACKDEGGFKWTSSIQGCFFWAAVVWGEDFHLITKREKTIIAPEMAGGQNSDERVEPHAIIQKRNRTMEDFDPRTWTNIPTWRANLEMRFTENLEDFAGLELDDIMDALLNHALKAVESENPLATDLAEAFFFEVDWQNIAQVILDKLEYK